MALESMTGYGRGRASRDGRDLLVELKSVNHRYLDISFRLPKQLQFLEDTLRAQLNEGRVKRGHVDVTVTYQNTRPDAATIGIDHALLARCAQETQAAAKELGLEPPTLSDLVHMCGALTVTQADEDADAVAALAQEACTAACEALCAMRSQEGFALQTDLSTNLDAVAALVAQVEQRAPEVPTQYRERLSARLAEWQAQGVDPQRITQEVALLADKCAIDEELSRLRSHITQFRHCVQDDGEVGRRMDFLLQEMNREANTIGSKAADASIAQCVVEIKCLLEKLREQAQNIV